MHLEVIDICVLLQCVGFKIKSLDSVGSDTTSLDPGVGRSVNIVCNLWLKLVGVINDEVEAFIEAIETVFQLKRSGLRVVLECESSECTCPASQNEHSSGFWQVSGISNGVIQSNKETGSSLVGSLPKNSMAIITREMYKLVQFSRKNVVADVATKSENKLTQCVLFSELSADPVINRTSSMSNLNATPPTEGQLPPKVDTPARYRSLDTLTNVNNMDPEIPAPGRLIAKTEAASDTSDILDDNPKKSNLYHIGSYKRQQTYTMSTPDKKANLVMKSKTSSPIGKLSESMMQSLLSAEKVAHLLRDKLASLVMEATREEERPGDISVASLALDVSKISVQQGQDPPNKNKCISSPNLSGISKRQDMSASTLRRVDSSSTSQLNVRQTPSSIKAPSRLKRLSPSFFRMKKDESTMKQNGDSCRKINEKPQSKLTSILKPRMSAGATSTTGIRTPTSRVPSVEAGSGSLSSSKKKMYSHVKSTIPKPNFLLKKE